MNPGSCDFRVYCSDYNAFCVMRREHRLVTLVVLTENSCVLINLLMFLIIVQRIIKRNVFLDNKLVLHRKHITYRYLCVCLRLFARATGTNRTQQTANKQTFETRVWFEFSTRWRKDPLTQTKHSYFAPLNECHRFGLFSWCKFLFLIGQIIIFCVPCL